MSALRIGILGGTFDPPHAGHLIVAQDVVEALELHELLFMPCHVPPHRDPHGISPASIRFRMVQAAVEPNDRLRASDLEFTVATSLGDAASKVVAALPAA